MTSTHPETEVTDQVDPAMDAAEAEGSAKSNPSETISEEQKKREFEDLKTMLLIRDLETKVKTYESKMSEIRDYVKKMEGEIENIRQRSQRETQRAIDQRLSDFFLSLLNVSDNFDRSLETAKDDSSPLANGIRMMHSQFSNFFQTAGLERLSPKGEIFDPHKHEAISTQPTDIKEMDQVVLQEVKAGFKFKDSILRPAQVVVGRFQSSDDGA